MDKTKTHLYDTYKRLILDRNTPAEWKWGYGEIFIIQVDVKIKLK